MSSEQPTKSMTMIGRQERGFTLLEILVVVTIMGTLLAVGVGGYMALARGADLKGTASRVRSVFVHARNSTIYESAPAGVFVQDIVRAELRDPVEHLEGTLLNRRDGVHAFDVKGHPRAVEIPDARVVRIENVTRVRSMGFKTVGMWHLEESNSTLGYLGRDLRIEGGETYWGKVGTAVLLNPPRERASDMIVALPARGDYADPFRMQRGGRVELWVFALRSTTTEGILAARKGTFELKVARDGTIRGGVSGDMLEVEDYYLSNNRWVKFVIEFGPEYVAIIIDDVLRAGTIRDGGTYDPPEEAELIFGANFSGVIDEIRVQARLEGEALDLPEPYKIVGPGEVYFDGRGRLDPTFHTAPVTWEIQKDEKSIDITIETSGRID
jgi:prepilin-type N-terminal cleavage/methylation domain-containing protein